MLVINNVFDGYIEKSSNTMFLWIKSRERRPQERSWPNAMKSKGPTRRTWYSMTCGMTGVDDPLQVYHFWFEIISNILCMRVILVIQTQTIREIIHWKILFFIDIATHILWFVNFPDMAPTPLHTHCVSLHDTPRLENPINILGFESSRLIIISSSLIHGIAVMTREDRPAPRPQTCRKAKPHTLGPGTKSSAPNSGLRYRSMAKSRPMLHPCSGIQCLGEWMGENDSPPWH